jgi:signal transduction histidine kinase
MCVNFLLVYKTQKQEVLEVAAEKADIIVKEFMVAIEFAADDTLKDETKEPTQAHQKIINVGEAGRTFSELLEIFTDFQISLISENPRNEDNNPDDYEKRALAAFEKDTSLEKMFKEVTINKKRHIRYLASLKINKSCLACHGDPKGETDITGFKKEGYKLGDVKGAVSITMPIHTEYKHMKKHLIDLLKFYIVITVFGVAVFFLILKKLIDLNKQINEKNIQLKKQHDMLKEYETEKSNLIEMIVHDLKNPLMTIINGIEIVIQSEAVKDERIDSVLKLAFSNAERLSGMISDILDVNAMESKKFTPRYETIDITAYINEIFNEQNLKLKDKVKSLDIDIKDSIPPFAVDKNLLKRIFENIISNAVKHSPTKEAQISTTVEYISDDDELLVSISDKGDGIPAEHLDKIFDKFFQVESKQYSPINKGLGLTFCKFAANLMGGKIWVKSKKGAGSTFYFTLKNKGG